MNKPITTLFMLASLDGKISTGDVDELDVDKDFPRIAGIKEGLYQYYDLEKQTDRVSFNSGKVQAKVGANQDRASRDRLRAVAAQEDFPTKAIHLDVPVELVKERWKKNKETMVYYRCLKTSV